MYNVRYSGTLTSEQVKTLKVITQEFEHVFGNGVDGAHEIELLPRAKPIHMPKPRYTPAKEEYMTKWARSMLDRGLYEFAGESKWAFMVHLAYKEGPPGREREEFEVRPCRVFPLLNDQTPKMAPNTPLLKADIEKLADKKLFIETDGAEFFHQIELHPGSRDFCTLWTPLGKLRPTRIIEGLKNASTVVKSRMNVALSTMAAEERKKKAFVNYLDDINGGVGTFDELVSAYRALLVMCSDNKITLKASKTKVGFPTCNAGGFELGNGVRKLADKHMAPLLALQPPTNVSELRRVLGCN